jgi:hypothetical protein
MSVDELGRAAASAARVTTATVDPELMLRRLHRRSRRRQIASITAATAVFAVVLAGVVVLARPTAAPPTSPPTPRPSASTPTASASTDSRCNNDTIICVGANRLRISLTVPVTVALPENFDDIVRLGDTSFESYQTDIDSAGVTVMENAVPVQNTDGWSRDPSGGTTAATMAHWLAKRPFLTGAKVTATTVDGRPAWRVSAVLKPRAALRAVKLTEGAVAPTFTDGHETTMGYNSTLAGEYTLLDIPGAGVTVLWSWTLDVPRSRLAGNRAFIDGLHW